MDAVCGVYMCECSQTMLIKMERKKRTEREERREEKHWKIKVEHTCTDPCLSAGVRLPRVPCLGTSGHAATPPPLFVYFHMTLDFFSVSKSEVDRTTGREWVDDQQASLLSSFN